MNTLSLFRNEKNPLVLPAGSVIFEKGQAGDVMYVVLDGTVDITVDGHQVDQLSPGDLFGEMALVDSSPRSATATAATDAKLAEVDLRRFQFLIQNTPF
ncbi:MAG: cyclic nucleotide-binding domain-containing protein, partial [Anaerolineae bacterium]